jgi:hypothetical protein
MTPKFLFVASLWICFFQCNLSADTQQIRVSVNAQGSDSVAEIVSALSREFRKLDGVVVTDTQPALKIDCVVGAMTVVKGYACSVAVTDADGHLLIHNYYLSSTIDSLAHNIATSMDGWIEKMRRDLQPSPSPTPRN